MSKTKSKSMLKKQRVAVIIMISAVILLGVALFAVSRIVANIPIEFVDPNDDTLYYIKRVDGVYALYTQSGEKCEMTEDGAYITAYGTVVNIDAETGKYSVDSGRELIFPHLYYDVYNALGMTTYPDSKIIDRIDVQNIYGSYAFLREELNTFILEGHPDVEYTPEAFAYLVNACAYPLSVMKLENPVRLPDGQIDLSEYGLCEETRTRTETDEDGVQTETEYTYFPARATLTVRSGETYTLYFGDATVTGTSFYARYEGKDDIFILAGEGISKYLTQKIESVISPSIVYPMTSSDYVHVKDFIIYSSIDYEKINALMAEKFPNFDRNTASEEEIAEYEEYYAEVFDAQSKKDCHFSFWDLEQRENSIYASLPFVSFLDYSEGYYINTNNVTLMLQDLYETTFVATEKLSPTEDDLEKYGLSDPEKVITYTYYYTKTNSDGKTEETEVFNKVYISKQNKDGSYYAYSDMYDMIVCVDESSFEFLSWDELDWYDPSYMQFYIHHVTDMIFEAPGTDIHFTLDNSQTLDGSYFPITNNTFDDGKDNQYEIKSEGGKYQLFANKEALSPLYNQDFVIMGIPFSAGVAENANYLFSEVIHTDTDGDGSNDTYMYYYYNVTLNSETGKYCLYATVAAVDDQGHAVSSAENIMPPPSYSSDCFITGGFSQYAFLVPKTSSVGKTLDGIYSAPGSGQWISADIFITADGKYVLVTPNSGEWATLSSVANNIYVANGVTSKLVSSAYSYTSNGITETVYTNTGKEISFNAETGKFELYDRATKTRANAKKDEVAPGILCSGSFYLTLASDLIIIDEETGDAGLLEFASSSKYLASVYANGKELDYTLEKKDLLGNTEYKLAIYNFQQLYSALLYGSFEGKCDLSDGEMAALRELDDFSGGSDGRCMLKLTVYAKDMKGNSKNLVYRFYRISERKAYVTIESLDSPDSESSSRDGYGSFYVLSSYVEKLISDANKVLSGTPVDANSKY